MSQTQRTQVMKQLLKDAFKSSELQYNLQDVIAVDDKIKVEEIPDAEIIKEAKYVLGKFTGTSGGFEQEEDYKGQNGPEQQAWAKKEVAALKRLLAKYDDSGAIRPVTKAEPGMVVTYRDTAYKLDTPAGPRRGWFASRQTDGRRFRLKSTQLAKSLATRGA